MYMLQTELGEAREAEGVLLDTLLKPAARGRRHSGPSDLFLAPIYLGDGGREFPWGTHTGRAPQEGTVPEPQVCRTGNEVGARCGRLSS